MILHGAGDLRLEDVPDPVPGAGEITVDVLAALTCATDAKMLRSGSHPALGPLPAPLGHEMAGVVREAGEGVGWPRPGDEVVVANSAPCLDCPACRAGRPNLCRRITYLTGAFAERVRVPAAITARNVHPLPGGTPPAEAAAAEPLACAVHTARSCRAAGPREVLVLGGGVQGFFLTALLARAGDRVTLLDPHPERRRRAREAGASAVHPVPADEDAVAALRGGFAGGEGAALVIEAVGRPQAWAMAVALACPGAEVVLHGGCPAGTHVDLPTGPLHYSELTLRGSYHHTPDAFREALALIAGGDIPVGRLLQREIGLADVPDVLRASRGEKHPVMPGVVRAS